MMVFLLPGIVALIFGFLAFRSRIKGVYFSILTQALTYGASLMFFRNDMLLGGNNGFTDFKFILGHDLREPATMRGLYIVTAIVLLLVFLGCRWLNGTKFGLVQRAIRDGENRVLFSGYAAAHFKLFIFVVAALIAAVGGALYVPQVGGINPSEMTPDKSLEAVVWVAVGGRGTLIGPIIGAISVNAVERLGHARVSGSLALLPRRPVHLRRAVPSGRNRELARPHFGLVETPESRCFLMNTGTEKTNFILTVEDVNKTFDGFKAISNLNFYLHAGELRTVIGPNGAGKSTFFDLITGRTKPDTGTIEFGWDVDLTDLNEYEINRLGHRAKISDADRLRGSHGIGKPPPVAQRSARCLRNSVPPHNLRTARPDRRIAEAHPPRYQARSRAPGSSRTGRSSGSKSACCWRKIRNFSSSTNPPPA